MTPRHARNQRLTLKLLGVRARQLRVRLRAGAAVRRAVRSSPASATSRRSPRRVPRSSSPTIRARSPSSSSPTCPSVRQLGVPPDRAHRCRCTRASSTRRSSSRATSPASAHRRAGRARHRAGKARRATSARPNASASRRRTSRPAKQRPHAGALHRRSGAAALRSSASRLSYTSSYDELSRNRWRSSRRTEQQTDDRHGPRTLTHARRASTTFRTSSRWPIIGSIALFTLMVGRRRAGSTTGCRAGPCPARLRAAWSFMFIGWFGNVIDENAARPLQPRRSTARSAWG